MVSEISVALKIHKMSVFSVVLPVWTGGSFALWRSEGWIALYLENIEMQSFFAGWI